MIFEGREIRIQVSGFVSCAPHSGRNTMGEHSGNNAARDMRGLGRGSPPIRGDLLAEFQQREREGSRERTAPGIREMQIKGKFSATRTNCVRFCVLRFWGRPRLRCCGLRERERKIEENDNEGILCVSWKCVMVRGMREEKLYSSMEVDDRKEEGIILTHKFIIRFFGT